LRPTLSVVGKNSRIICVCSIAHSQKGWYVLHEITLETGDTALVGSFGYWFGGDKFSEKIAPGKGVSLNKAQLEAVKKQHAEATKKAEAQRKADAERASQEATRAAQAQGSPSGSTGGARRIRPRSQTGRRRPQVERVVVSC
jgi:pyruvate/2-oxoglutarate dehydrogenase complex dihydrolipoamide acyltransferase (E2) component